MTADAPRLRVTTNLAFGIILILFGTVLILDRLQLVDASEMLRFWPIGLVLVGATLVIQSSQRVDTAQPARPHDSVNLGHVIIMAIIAIFAWNGFSPGVTVRTDSSETARVVAVMGRHQQISAAPVFRAAEVTTIMGRAELDLRKTTVAPGEEAVHVVPVERIDYLESQDDYVAVRCAGRSYLKEQTLGDLEAQLDQAVFVRIHRRYILNLAKLAKIEMGVTDSRIAILRDGTQLPISRTGYARLRELL